MVFGEIVEPSSRALWEDDFVEYSNEERTELQWQGDSEVPKCVNKIIIGETAQIITLLQKCVLQSNKPVCELLTANIYVYKIENDSYIIIYKSQPNIIVGEITEKLASWLKAAKEIILLTSAPITLHQNCFAIETAPCFIRSLSSKTSQSSPHLKLEVPNLVTGLSASVLSYCIHTQIASCTLYVGFLDEVLLDSLNTGALLDLLKYLQISPLREYISEDKVPLNNLYM